MKNEVVVLVVVVAIIINVISLEPISNPFISNLKFIFIASLKQNYYLNN